MTNAAERTKHLKDTSDFYAAIADGDLPAVSYVKPSGFVDGHPASSKLILFEGFVKKIVDAVQANPKLWDETAIMVTFDEGGGYWDSGYVQPLDFFGDGTRIPMIVVSPYSVGGHVSHGYSDHASILKFIEANWRPRAGQPERPGRSAQSADGRGQSLCSRQLPGHRRHDGYVRLERQSQELGAGIGTAGSRRRSRNSLSSSASGPGLANAASGRVPSAPPVRSRKSSDPSGPRERSGRRDRRRA